MRKRHQSTQELCTFLRLDIFKSLKRNATRQIQRERTMCVAKQSTQHQIDPSFTNN